MDHIEKKYEIMCTMFKTLHQAIDCYSQQGQMSGGDEMLAMFRDSLIKRFEYCTDHFWKYMSRYLREVLKIKVETESPRDVFRFACKADLVSQDESEYCFEIVRTRNQTSHIYKEEFAEIIASKIPEFYAFMMKILQRMDPKK